MTNDSERLEELFELQLSEKNFQISIDGVLIPFNSNIIKKILHDQALANELRRTHRFYIESKNGICAGVTRQILDLSNYGGKVTK
jgi:hypothetical protein